MCTAQPVFRASRSDFTAESVEAVRPRICTERAPALTNAEAIESPMPRAPPVIIMMRPRWEFCPIDWEREA